MTPRETWANPKAYDDAAAKLAAMFHKNFAKFVRHVDTDVVGAGPSLGRAVAAE
jgi:phosphoenolpyruvate carboxykinase (ATP)